jgi:hypothetical protein
MGNCFCQNKEDKPLKKVAFSDNHVPPLEVPEEIFEPVKQVVPVQVLPTLKRKITEINVNEPEVSVKRVVDREEPGTILHQINTQCYTKVALKFPHGLIGAQYDEDHKKFDPCNIDDWLSSLYKNKLWTSWIVYNDESEHLNPNHNEQEKQEKSRRGSVSPSKSRRGSVSPSVSDKSDAPAMTCMLKSHSTGGHCKGILAWNATHVSWLVHSVPNFPREFTGSTISPIELSEHIYGQSFIQVTRQADEAFVKQAIAHIYLMNAHVFMKHNVPDVLQPKDMISTLSFSEEITHIAKSPKNEIDIYSEYLTIYAPDWEVETWKRGHAINTPSTIKDITHLSIFGLKYKDSQDHSKWATSDQYYWIGDLNRMTSQYKRGGGGFLVKNQGIALALKSIIVATEAKLISPLNSYQEKS